MIDEHHNYIHWDMVDMSDMSDMADMTDMSDIYFHRDVLLFVVTSRTQCRVSFLHGHVKNYVLNFCSILVHVSK